MTDNQQNTASESVSKSTPANAPPEFFEEDEISLLDLATTLGEEKKMIFGLSAVAGVVAVAVSLLITPIYTAKTTLVPPAPSGGGGAAAMLSQLGGLASLAGISGGGGNSSETLVNMLKSRSAKDQLIDQFDLMNKREAKFKQDVYAYLDSVIRVTSDKKSNMITIEVDDKDPQFAADLANASYQVLRNLMTRIAVTEAQQRRKFFEDQFAKAKEDLAQAEVKLKETQERTGLLELKSQAEATIRAVAQARAEIATREVQLSALRQFATAENAEYRRVVAELAGLRSELRKLESGASDGGVGATSAGKLPEQGLEYVRAFREVKYQEAIFEIMAKQFELAKVDEARDGGNVQQLDAAVPPERRSKPKRTLIVIASVMAAGLLGVLLAFVKAAARNALQDPQSGERWRAMKRAWGLRGN